MHPLAGGRRARRPLAPFMTPENVRRTFLLIGLASLGSVAFAAIYLQAMLHLLPCPMCVAQRIAFSAIGLVALVAAVHGPRSLPGQRVYAGLMGLLATAGLASAGRQIWLTYFPESFECGISPEEAFLNSLPIAQWWPAMFAAEGDCAAVKWRFLGLSIPELSAIAFALVLVISLWLALRRR